MKIRLKILKAKSNFNSLLDLGNGFVKIFTSQYKIGKGLFMQQSCINKKIIV